MNGSKRILITGATGFAGGSLVRYFAAKGWNVLASGRQLPPPALVQMADYVQLNIENTLPRQAIDAVIHAAALASDTASWEALKRTNLYGTQHVFEATRDCPCFIYISSSSVYDHKHSIHIENEGVDRKSLSAYGLSKRMAEEWLVKQDWKGRSLFILRPRAIYGMGDRVLIPRLMRLVKMGQIISPGAMRISSSLTHIDNLCEAVILCMAKAAAQIQTIPAIFNVADKEPYQMRDVVHQLLSEIHGKQLPFRALPLFPLQHIMHMLTKLHLRQQFTPYSLEAVSRNFVLDLNKITNEIEYSPKKNFLNTFREVAMWVKQTGIERVKKGGVDLSWLGVSENYSKA